MKRLHMLAICLVVLFPLFAIGPVSQEASVIDINRSGEVEMRATGVYNSPAGTKTARQSDINKNGVALATEDAKMAAIHTLLFGGPDPILSTEALKSNFETRGGFVYEKANIEKYVASTSNNLPNTTPLDDGQGVKITTTIVVNRNILLSDLQKMGVLDTTTTQTRSTDTRTIATVATTTTKTPEQRTTAIRVDRQKLRVATATAIADIPAKSVVAIIGADSAILTADDVDLPDLLIDVLIELNMRTIDPGRLDRIKTDTAKSDGSTTSATLSVSEQIDLGSAAGADYIINVLSTDGNLRVQCINVKTGTIEGRGTVEQ